MNFMFFETKICIGGLLRQEWGGKMRQWWRWSSSMKREWNGVILGQSFSGNCAILNNNYSRHMLRKACEVNDQYQRKELYKEYMD